MSLNRTLDRLFDEIRREAKRNPDFADRLDAILQGHVSRRDVDEETIAAEAEPAIVESQPVAAVVEPEPDAPPAPPAPPRPAFNPVGVIQRDGEDTLNALLGAMEPAEILALIAEHNLDPVGAAEGLEREALAAFVASQAKKRVERDKKLFDY